MVKNIKTMNNEHNKDWIFFVDKIFLNEEKFKK